MFSRSTARRATAVAILGLLLTGCASTGDSGSPEAKRTTTSLDAVKVSGEKGQKPSIEVPSPFAVQKTDRKVLTPGDGAEVTAGQRVTMDYVGLNGTDGKEFDTSFGREQQQAFTLDAQQIIKGMVDGLAGVKVGSRVLIAIPPEDGYGTQGVPAAGIGPTDTLVFVVDVKSASTPLKRATGTAVTPKAGLPKVTLDKAGKPAITLPSGDAPKQLVVQPLITGKGPKVQKNQTITVHYTGIIWPGGKQFDSSWTNGSPANFTIGAGRVISGWDEGLVGQTVGSQVLLVIPPDKGYGAAGNPQGGIKGTDTLVFVVDILDAA